MDNIRKFWKDMWNDHAKSDNMFVQTGFSSYTPFEYFLMQKDIVEALDFQREDIVLDAGAGVGWTSMYISPFVKAITLFDFADKLVEKSRELVKHFGNIRAFQDDILFIDNVGDKIYSKIIVNSVIQYLENYDQIKIAMKNIHSIMSPGGKALFSRNPDTRKREDHIKSYEKLDWSKERIENSLKLEETRLWMDFDIIKRIAAEIGYTNCYEVTINPLLWQSTHMFDFVVTK